MTRHTASHTAAVTPVESRKRAGQRAYLSGASAENAVAAEYGRLGNSLLETRWRGQEGEIDLIVQDGETIVFVEVKKSRTHAQAIARLRPAQMRRIHAAASQYLAFMPNGQLSNVRFDLAVVDAIGRVKISENAFGHF